MPQPKMQHETNRQQVLQESLVRVMVTMNTKLFFSVDAVARSNCYTYNQINWSDRLGQSRLHTAMIELTPK